MADDTFLILAGANDGYTGSVSPFNIRTGTDVYIGNLSSNNYQAYFRFTNVTIPAGSVIDSAILRLTSAGSWTVNTVNVKVHFEDADNPAAPAGDAAGGQDIIDRVKTAGINWNNIEDWSAGEVDDSPDISADLQTVIDRVGWNSGQAVIVFVIDNSSTANAYRRPASYENATYDQAQLIVSHHVAFQPVLSESINISENISIESDLVTQENIELSESVNSLLGFDETLEMSQGITVSESVAGELEFTGAITEVQSIQVSLYRNVELGLEIPTVFESLTISEEIRMVYTVEVSDSVLLSESVTVRRGYDAAVAESFAVEDIFTAFNYSSWLRQNLSKAKLRFYLTITGAADLTTDIEIPIRSFYARKRSGDPSYLQVVIPGAYYAGAVANRANGDLLLKLGYEVGGAISLLEQIAVVDIDTIRTDEGAVNRAISLSGHRTITYSNNVIQINRNLVTYRAWSGSSLTFRFAYIDPYLNPGDTLVVGDDAMTVQSVIYIVDALRATMEVSEAG